VGGEGSRRLVHFRMERRRGDGDVRGLLNN
jgi:hypothetical protein